ncbi:MAG: CDP-diacylglycerol--glycerol-3-phosphate 3-phosphatidyltransferase [Desulfobacterales bacterium]|nr:CDP-diacylglycerol--glycerol-3-phosphate 3-phosphatidyltransferase [Desulfobacterales bacterium]
MTFAKTTGSGGRLKGWFRHPNTLTLIRIAAVPGIILLMLAPNRPFTFMAALLFTGAAITDFFDGFFARQRGMESNFGRIMDPLADKLLVSSAFIMLTAQGWVPAWMVCLILGREMAVTGLRNFLVEHSKDVSASWLGKYKVGFQIAAIIPLLIHYPYFSIDFHGIGTVFLWGALVMTVWSGVDYFVRFRGLLRMT